MQPWCVHLLHQTCSLPQHLCILDKTTLGRTLAEQGCAPPLSSLLNSSLRIASRWGLGIHLGINICADMEPPVDHPVLHHIWQKGCFVGPPLLAFNGPKVLHVCRGFEFGNLHFIAQTGGKNKILKEGVHEFWGRAFRSITQGPNC